MAADFVITAGDGVADLLTEHRYDAAYHDVFTTATGELVVIEGRVVVRLAEGHWVGVLLVERDEDPEVEV